MTAPPTLEARAAQLTLQAEADGVLMFVLLVRPEDDLDLEIVRVYHASPPIPGLPPLSELLRQYAQREDTHGPETQGDNTHPAAAQRRRPIRP